MEIDSVLDIEASVRAYGLAERRQSRAAALIV